MILAEEVPNEGLGRAINDRLRRAANIYIHPTNPSHADSRVSPVHFLGGTHSYLATRSTRRHCDGYFLGGWSLTGVQLVVVAYQPEHRADVGLNGAAFKEGILVMA